MKTHSLPVALIIALLAAAPAAAQLVVKTDTNKRPDPPVHMTAKERREFEKNAKKPPSQGTAFSIEVVPDSNNLYSVLLTDENNRSVPGNFIRSQIDIFRALLDAASQFALTAEEAGAPGAPKTTRFMDRNDKSFIIDVEKTPQESHFFLTIQSVLGKTTVNAGTVRRDGKPAAQDPLLYKILAKVQEALSGQQ